MNDSATPEFLTVPCAHCGGNIELPAQAADMEVQCPHCGWHTPVHPPTATDAADPGTVPGAATVTATRGKRRFLVLGIATLIVVAAVAVLVLPRLKQSPMAEGAGPNNTPSPAEPAIALPPRLALSTLALQTTPGTSLRHAVGAVTNASAQQRFGLKITVALLDDQGIRLGASSDYRDVLDPGGVWNFKALVTFPKTASARLEGLTEEEE